MLVARLLTGCEHAGPKTGEEFEPHGEMGAQRIGDLRPLVEADTGMDVTDSRDTGGDIFRLVGQRALVDAGEVGEVPGEGRAGTRRSISTVLGSEWQARLRCVSVWRRTPWRAAVAMACS
jgi:hypothetical protein